MRLRGFLFFGALAAATATSCVDLPVSDSVDSRPWGGGGYGGYPDYDRGYDVERERAWEHDRRSYTCEQLDERIRYDRSKLAGIDPSKHHKAADWYRDDLRDAERERYACEENRRRKREDADWERRDRDRRNYDQRDHARADCAKIRSRIVTDRAKLAEINPSKHHKAAQFYQDDLRNAERELAACK